MSSNTTRYITEGHPEYCIEFFGGIDDVIWHNPIFISGLKLEVLSEEEALLWQI